MAYLERNGVNIYYEVHGRGPAILLTHGFSATSAMWQPQLQALSSGYTVIVWDMRGHGLSAAPEAQQAYSESETTADMAAVLDAAGFEHAIIGGLSLGGYMSMAFNLDYPERVDALLIIDTGPGFKKDEARDEWNAYALRTAEDIAQRGVAALAGGSDEQRKAVHNNIQGVARAGRGMLTQSSPRVIESLPQVRVPALVVVGADDEPFIAASNYMAGKIPGAEKVVIPDAGHAANMDQPERFNESVLQFLAARCS